MPTYAEIFVRSPKIEKLTGVAGDATTCEVYLWNDPSSQPGTPTYTLSKPIPTGKTNAFYDISPYCREYITHTSYTEITSLTTAPVAEYCYCTVKLYKNAVLTDTLYYIAFDGYGYYEDDYTPTLSPVLLTEGTYYIQEGVNSGGVYVHDDQVDTWSATYTGLTSGGTTNVNITAEMSYLPYIHTSYAGEGNTLEIKKNTVVQKTFTFEEVCEPKYTPIKCDFVNRFGMWQRVIFFKASRQTFEASGEEYHLMPSDVNYDVTENRRQTFNRNARRKIKCNTGFVPESYKEVMKEILLSEKINLDDEPVKLVTQSVELQEHINNKTINYEVEFEYSHNQRQYVL